MRVAVETAAVVEALWTARRVAAFGAASGVVSEPLETREMTIGVGSQEHSGHSPHSLSTMPAPARCCPHRPHSRRTSAGPGYSRLSKAMAACLALEEERTEAVVVPGAEGVVLPMRQEVGETARVAVRVAVRAEG